MTPKLYRTVHPQTPWLVVYTDPTKRNAQGKPKKIQKWFADEEEAKKRHGEMLKTAASVGTSGLSLDAPARSDYYSGRAVLDQAGFGDMSITEALREYVKDRPAVALLSTTLAELLLEFKIAKEIEDNSAAPTVKNLINRVTAWVRDENLVTLADITDKSLLALKQREGVSAQTKINDMAAISSFLSWLVNDRKLLKTNPLLKMRRPKTDLRIPRVLRPAQVKALLDAALAEGEGRLVRFLALQLLAGLRPGEAMHITQEQVRLDAAPPFVRVAKGKKRRKVRPAPTLPNFTAWWNAASGPKPKRPKPGEKSKPSEPVLLYDQDRDRRLFDKIRERAGLIKFERTDSTKRPVRTLDLWQEDICRHTWISARLQSVKNEAQVAYEAGTSKDMIHGHYLDLMDDTEVTAIAGILPPASGQTCPSSQLRPSVEVMSGNPVSNNIVALGSGSI